MVSLVGEPYVPVTVGVDGTVVIFNITPKQLEEPVRIDTISILSCSEPPSVSSSSAISSSQTSSVPSSVSSYSTGSYEGKRISI